MYTIIISAAQLIPFYIGNGSMLVISYTIAWFAIVVYFAAGTFAAEELKDNVAKKRAKHPILSRIRGYFSLTSFLVIAGHFAYFESANVTAILLALASIYGHSISNLED